MKKILVYGAGAIGRGFLPWVFPPDEFEYWFIDTNRYIVNRLKRPGGSTYITMGGGYNIMVIHAQDDPPPEFDAIFTAVGPRNVMSLVQKFKGTKVPIICCENDSRLHVSLRALTGNNNIFFGIPDVIASNTAPKRLKDLDPIAIVTECGKCYIEDGAKELGGNAEYLDSEGMRREWKAKLYLHNTPHCIAAYLGYLKGCHYISEAMDISEIRGIVEGVISETTTMINTMYGIDIDFAKEYGKKEITRFSNHLLCDPISRVGREPIRKLQKDDRLIGAAALCIQAGIYPKNIIKGITAALKYVRAGDPDFEIMKQIGPVDKFLDYIYVNPEEPIYKVLTQNNSIF